jgi:hypothetical protein
MVIICGYIEVTVYLLSGTTFSLSGSRCRQLKVTVSKINYFPVVGIHFDTAAFTSFQQLFSSNYSYRKKCSR